jgi:hypothetical protein
MFVFDVLSFLPPLVGGEHVKPLYFFKLFRLMRVKRVFLFFNIIRDYIMSLILDKRKENV